MKLIGRIYDNFPMILIIVIMFAFMYSRIARDEPIAVTRQHGFTIEVDNDLMIAARRCHNIGERDIRWDTLNNNFVYIMEDGQIGTIFTEDFYNSPQFKEYLDTKKDKAEK